MVKQIEIEKKGFLKPFKSRKNTVSRIGRLWRIWEEEARWFQAKKGLMSSNSKPKLANSSPIKPWRFHGKK
jgi:hypothetical protein